MVRKEPAGRRDLTTGGSHFVEIFHHLGFPDYFRILLGVAKILATPTLLVPLVPATLREWAYAGFTITRRKVDLPFG